MRIAALLAAWALFGPAVGVALATASEFQVNATAAGDQGYPAACVGGGGTTVAWESRGADGSGAVLARRFDRDGTPRGAEVRLDALAAGAVQAPAVACAPDGSYLVVWERRDGADFDVAARRVGADGGLSAPLALGADAAGRQRDAAVCGDAAGNFVVAWESDAEDGDGYGIVAQRFDAAGRARGEAFAVNATAAGAQQHPAIACGEDGRFAVVWESRGQDGDGGAIAARRYDADGGAGVEVLLNTTAAGDQRLPALVALPADAGFMAAWESEGQDGDESAIVARLLDADLVPLGGEIAVNSATIYSQEQPALARRGDDIVIAWSSPGDGDGYGIFARRFDAAGRPRGAEVLVNVATAGAQGAVSDEGGGLTAVGSADGALLIAWQSVRRSLAGADGDGAGVFARAGLPAGCAGDCDGDGAVTIAELIAGVGLALGDGPVTACAALDADGDGRIVVAELIAAVAAALNGCGDG